MKIIVTIALVLVAISAAYSSVYTVDRTEYVYLTQLGRHEHTFDGATEGGLHFKLPWIQSVQVLDSRLQSFDLPEAELLTHDPEGKTVDKTITVVAYVCWRIAGRENVDWFIRRVVRADNARVLLGDEVRSRLGVLIGQMRMSDLFSADVREPGRVDRNLDRLRSELMRDIEPRAREEYGIELVDIRLRRLSNPEAVKSAIYDRIKSEREKKVSDYQSKGRLEAEKILSDADQKAQVIRAEASATEKRLKGAGEAEADRIRNESQSKDVEFYTFLKKLEEYQRILGDSKTVLLLSSHRELFDLLYKPPAANGSARPIAGPISPKPTPDKRPND